MSRKGLCMSYMELGKNIGKEGHYVVGDLRVVVKITDAKKAYGSVRYLITPKEGIGQTWVDESSLAVLS